MIIAKYIFNYTEKEYLYEYFCATSFSQSVICYAINSNNKYLKTEESTYVNVSH